MQFYYTFTYKEATEVNLHAGIQEYWDTGIQGYRDTGIQEYWNTGIQGYREYKDLGIHQYRNTGKHGYSDTDNIRILAENTMDRPWISLFSVDDEKTFANTYILT